MKYASYLDKMCLKKEESRLFKNMPFQTMEELLTDKSEDGNYQKKRTKIFWGKKEYRISKELINEVGEELKETGEKIFNAATAISQLELDSKVHDKDFMIEKMSAVITNYISYGD